MMGRALFIVLMAMGVHSAALAACGGGLEAKSAGVYIGMGDCEYNEETIVVARRGGGVPRRFLFAAECAWDEMAITPKRPGHVPDASYQRGFFCQVGGRSLLAGARYSVAFEWKHKDGCGKVPRVAYVCRAGCTKAVPREFIVLPSDCDF